jgi:hypothetical protein
MRTDVPGHLAMVCCHTRATHVQTWQQFLLQMDAVGLRHRGEAAVAVRRTAGPAAYTLLL